MPEYFRMPQIAPLIRDMAVHKAKQDTFGFEFNNVHFDVIVLVDRTPFELLFGVIDYNFAFTLHMYEGYQLEYLTSEVYQELCNILHLTYRGDGFSSFVFLQYIAAHVPNHYSGQILQPHQVAAHMVNDITCKEEIDAAKKIYFKGWKHHETDGRDAKNFAKTKKLLGEQAYKFCLANNISSCWSENPRERKDYYSPQEYMARKGK